MEIFQEISLKESNNLDQFSCTFSDIFWKQSTEIKKKKEMLRSAQQALYSVIIIQTFLIFETPQHTKRTGYSSSGHKVMYSNNPKHWHR